MIGYFTLYHFLLYNSDIQIFRMANNFYRYIIERIGNMKFEIFYKDTFPLIDVQLESGESIKAESGAMVSMSSNINLQGKMEGGFGKAIGRMFSGEKFFFQTLLAENGPGRVQLAPTTIGHILHFNLEKGRELIIQKDGFLAGSNSIVIDTHVQNLTKGLFSGEGFFVLRARGYGDLFLNAFGAIHPIELGPGETYIVDNAHLVAWDSSLQYNIKLASSKGMFSSFTSGEGFVTEFCGPGVVYIQTRNLKGFAYSLPMPVK